MKDIYTIILFTVFFIPLNAENVNIDSAQYRRSSLYSLMIKHSGAEFADEISKAFLQMPIPDKYNDHNLSVQVINTNLKKLDDNVSITSFLNDNNIGSRLVSKWFDRDIKTGACDMQLIKERGLYDASELNKALADKSVRGKALLEDAGEDLISNTFVLVNDIRYRDKSKGSKAIGSIFRVIGAAAAAYTGNSDWNKTGDSFGDLTESYKGFSVIIHSYLYQLVWDEETSSTFYKYDYSSKGNSSVKKQFDSDRGKYKLKYIGEQISNGSTTSFVGIKLDEPIAMVRKACQRALDENIASLQKNFDQFKVRVPLIRISPIQAPIGLKEGVNSKSQYEVLEVSDENGHKVYKRVGVIAPVESLIWDNRYMAEEEHAYGSNLKFTTFKKISGGDFYPGMLIREIK